MNIVSGLNFLILKTKSERSFLLDSNIPSIKFRLTISFTPSIFAASICSFDRIFTILLLVISLSFEPLEPVVANTYTTSEPFLIHLAIVAPVPISASSG